MVCHMDWDSFTTSSGFGVYFPTSIRRPPRNRRVAARLPPTRRAPTVGTWWQQTPCSVGSAATNANRCGHARRNLHPLVCVCVFVASEDSMVKGPLRVHVGAWMDMDRQCESPAEYANLSGHLMSHVFFGLFLCQFATDWYLTTWACKSQDETWESKYTYKIHTASKLQRPPPTNQYVNGTFYQAPPSAKPIKSITVHVLELVLCKNESGPSGHTYI